MTDVKLPPLPEPAIHQAHGLANAFAYGFHANQMTEYARLAVLQERERCAKICDEYGWHSSNPMNFANNCADAIRKGE